MRLKLIAVVVASLFAQSAYGQDNFVWSGSVEVGGRGTNIDGANRNGGVGPPTATTTPAGPTSFVGPSDGAKAQQYQDIDSAAIGFIDIRGSNKSSYLRAFALGLHRPRRDPGVPPGGVPEGHGNGERMEVRKTGS